MAVIDASVAVRWFVSGPGSDMAASWLERQDSIAPELICAEVGNALWRYRRAEVIDAAEARAIMGRLPSSFVQLAPASELAGDALALAIECDHPIYDCFYLALARREKQQLVTLDRRLADIARGQDITVSLLA